MPSWIKKPRYTDKETEEGNTNVSEEKLRIVGD
jgi:hypothetical protein